MLTLEASAGSEASDSHLRLTWLGINHRASVGGVDELPGKVNYLTGKDRDRWQTEVPTYARVQYKNIYPGVDLLYYGDNGRLEYDLVLTPGAQPDNIRFRVRGGNRTHLDQNGDLIVRVGKSEVRLHKPVAYQAVSSASTGHDARIPVHSEYVLTSQGEVHFKIGAYDRSRPLIIDPQLTYSSYFGGTGSDTSWKVAIDSYGIAYLTGWSRSADFPLVGALQTQSTATTAVIVKLDPKLPGAASLLYSTYLGGNSGETAGRGIAIVVGGRIFVSGDTNAPDFPVTVGAYQTTCKISGTQCSTDVFAAEIDPTGSALLYSTYLGGTGTEYGYGLTIDSSLNICLTGPTGSSNFPTTAGAFQGSLSGGDDGFVAVLNPAGGGSGDLVYSTYLGGAGNESSWAIAVDQTQAIYVAGNTTSSDFPTASAYSTTYSGMGTYSLGDAFVAKLRPAGGGMVDLVYSTYLGGMNDDRVEAMAVAPDNSVYITGFTLSSNFPVTASAFQTTFGGGTCAYNAPCGDAFIAKVDTLSSGVWSLLYSTLFGGSSFDMGHAIALDSAGFVYLAGETASTNLPLRDPIQSTCFGGCTPLPMTDVLLAKFDLTQSGQPGLLFSTYLGGGNVDTAWGLAVDADGNMYVTGQVFSTNFPTVIPFQPFCNNCSPFSGPAPSGDVFFMKVCTSECPAPTVSPGELTFPSGNVGSTSGPQIVTILNSGAGDMMIAGIAITGPNANDFSQMNSCPVVLSPLNACTINVTFTPTLAGTRTATVTITDNGSGSPRTVTLSGTGVASGPPAPTPWPNGYAYQATFTVNVGQAPGAQANFPALIAGTYADFRTIGNGGRIANTCSQTVGSAALGVPCDLIFTADAAGATPLSWEFDNYNAATGAVTIWVKTPALANGTILYAWYGKAAATTLQTSPAAVWSSDYVAACHLKENPAGAAPQLMDSATGAHHGTMSGTLDSSQQQSGQVGGSLDFTTAKAWAALANGSDFSFERTDAFSLAGWFKMPTNTGATLVSKLDSAANTGWGMFQFATGTTPRFALGLQGNGSANNFAMAATSAISTGVWHYVVVTYAGTSTVAGMRIYVDGVNQSLTTIMDSLTVSIVNTIAPALNGRGGSTSMSSDGIDEVRVFSKGVVLSPDWVTASYNNQFGPASFFSAVTGLTAP